MSWSVLSLTTGRTILHMGRQNRFPSPPELPFICARVVGLLVGFFQGSVFGPGIVAYFWDGALVTLGVRRSTLKSKLTRKSSLLSLLT